VNNIHTEQTCTHHQEHTLKNKAQEPVPATQPLKPYQAHEPVLSLIAQMQTRPSMAQQPACTSSNHMLIQQPANKPATRIPHCKFTHPDNAVYRPCTVVYAEHWTVNTLLWTPLQPFGPFRATLNNTTPRILLLSCDPTNNVAEIPIHVCHHD
jgi:hypothetical protein